MKWQVHRRLGSHGIASARRVARCRFRIGCRRHAVVRVDLYTDVSASTPLSRRTPGAPATLSVNLRTAFDAEVIALQEQPDPLHAIRVVGNTFAALDTELERLASLRLKAVAELKADGWGHGRIAAATGLSKSRVAQLAAAARHP
jgi:DNA-directed RNA polymerase specialized sigma24 family protein